MRPVFLMPKNIFLKMRKNGLFLRKGGNGEFFMHDIIYIS